jgi:hypothetical protein
MFLSIIMPRRMKSDKREDRAVRLGQSLGIILVTPKKHQHR